jgi:hypothetical protein
MLKIVNTYGQPFHLHKDGKHLLLQPGVNSISEEDRKHFEAKINGHFGLSWVNHKDEVSAPQQLESLNDVAVAKSEVESKSSKKRKAVLENLEPINE